MTNPPIGQSSPTVRPASAGDLPAVLALLTSTSLPHVGVAESFAHFLVAEQEATIVGVIGLEPRGGRYALLRSAAVAPEARNRGVGRALVELALDAAASSGCAALYLLTTTAETYFPKFGFVRVDRDAVPTEIRTTDEFASACPASATVMMRAIGPMHR